MDIFAVSLQRSITSVNTTFLLRLSASGLEGSHVFQPAAFMLLHPHADTRGSWRWTHTTTIRSCERKKQNEPWSFLFIIIFISRNVIFAFLLETVFSGCRVTINTMNHLGSNITLIILDIYWYCYSISIVFFMCFVWALVICKAPWTNKRYPALMLHTVIDHRPKT